MLYIGPVQAHARQRQGEQRQHHAAGQRARDTGLTARVALKPPPGRAYHAAGRAHIEPRIGHRRQRRAGPPCYGGTAPGRRARKHRVIQQRRQYGEPAQRPQRAQAAQRRRRRCRRRKRHTQLPRAVHIDQQRSQLAACRRHGGRHGEHHYGHKRPAPIAAAQARAHQLGQRVAARPRGQQHEPAHAQPHEYGRERRSAIARPAKARKEHHYLPPRGKSRAHHGRRHSSRHPSHLPHAHGAHSSRARICRRGAGLCREGRGAMQDVGCVGRGGWAHGHPGKPFPPPCPTSAHDHAGNAKPGRAGLFRPCLRPSTKFR